MSFQGYLNDIKFAKIVISILVKRLGGKVKISQSDIDAIAYNTLMENSEFDGTIELHFVERPRNT